MLNITYETFAKNQSRLKKRIQLLREEVGLKKYKKHWHPLDLKEKKAHIGAEDGSINHKKYKGLILYAINASAPVYNDKITDSHFSDIDILYPYREIKDRLDIYRTIFEFKASLRVIDDVDLFLVDGSLYSDLVAPRDLGTGLSKEEKKEVMEFLPEIEQSDEVEIVSKRLAGNIKGPNRFQKIAFLEYLEYISTLKRFIERGRDKVVGVSKTASTSSFEEGMPDIAVFDEVSKEPGFGFAMEREKILQKKFPIYGEFFTSFVPFFSYFYARLEKNRGVFMMEVPRDIDEKEIIDLLSKIRSTSVDGYPYLLRKAHKDVVITNRDIEKFANSLGISNMTGREALSW
ncbi:DNA double-strand break repair nuclease NurA [archaeon]|nr:DNA double-strand break repair nuclease NurA [archaeon]